MTETDWEQMAKDLWQLLDDIDTCSDAYKPEKTPYYKAVMIIANKRNQYLESLDGYNLSVVKK